jgi:hypothetical protein
MLVHYLNPQCYYPTLDKHVRLQYQDYVLYLVGKFGQSLKKKM